MKQNKQKEWETELEYSLPDILTEIDKQIIRNKVFFLFAKQREEIIKEIEEVLPEKYVISEPYRSLIENYANKKLQEIKQAIKIINIKIEKL